MFFFCPPRFLAILAARAEDEDHNNTVSFERCLESALVSTEFFCLPGDYRKDVPPPSESSTRGRARKRRNKKATHFMTRKDPLLVLRRRKSPFRMQDKRPNEPRAKPPFSLFGLLLLLLQ